MESLGATRKWRVATLGGGGIFEDTVAWPGARWTGQRGKWKNDRVAGGEGRFSRERGLS